MRLHGNTLEDTITVYVGIALGVCALAIAGHTLFLRMFRAGSRSDTPLLDSMIGATTVTAFWARTLKGNRFALTSTLGDGTAARDA